MFSHPQKAKSCDKKLLRMSQNLKKQGSVHTISFRRRSLRLQPLRVGDVQQLSAVIYSNELEFRNCHLVQLLLNITGLKAFPLHSCNTKLLIYLNLLLSLLRLRNQQQASQGKSWKVQLCILFSYSNDIQVSQNRTPSERR